MRLGYLNGVRTDPGSKLDSLEALKADVLIQPMVQRARAREDQPRGTDGTCSCLC